MEFKIVKNLVTGKVTYFIDGRRVGVKYYHDQCFKYQHTFFGFLNYDRNGKRYFIKCSK